MSEFVCGIFIGAVSCFAFTWTLANGMVEPSSFNFASKVCESHGGLSYLDEDKTRFSDAVCNDGVSISYDNVKIKE